MQPERCVKLLGKTLQKRILPIYRDNTLQQYPTGVIIQYIELSVKGFLNFFTAACCDTIDIVNSYRDNVQLAKRSTINIIMVLCFSQ